MYASTGVILGVEPTKVPLGHRLTRESSHTALLLPGYQCAVRFLCASKRHGRVSAQQEAAVDRERREGEGVMSARAAAGPNVLSRRRFVRPAALARGEPLLRANAPPAPITSRSFS